ncbi:MAG: hypothetical protein DRJ50_04360 [Actinobacteria bacterium]|nr:MAG: hypothetical protein DRJ50_04360 [Actinomycetota bacterium]
MMVGMTDLGVAPGGVPVDLPVEETAVDEPGGVDAGFDWLNDVRVVPAGEVLHRFELIEAALKQAGDAIDVLSTMDADRFDGERLELMAVGVEGLRRKVDRAGVVVAGHVDVVQPFRGDGFFNAKVWLKHRLKLSGVEAFRRVQTARMHARIPLWADAQWSGLVGVAQTELMARVVANPRIDDEVIDRDRWGLLNDAMDLSYEEFERNVKMWEMLADPDGAKSKAERLHANRDVRLRPLPDGGWGLTGSLDEIGGVEFNEILAQFIGIEWRSDWDEARQRLGDKASVTNMRRTEPQRRADALLSMARTAARTNNNNNGRSSNSSGDSGGGGSSSSDSGGGGSSGGGGVSSVTVNMLIDDETFEATVMGDPINPARWRDVVCRTDTGRRLHPDDVVNAALWANIRRVVYDSAGVVIDLGRRSRLFTGAAREAVMLLTNKCVWVGCDQPVAWCQADHSLSWSAHGATVPRNGQPLCGRHNRHKERGYQVHRDNNGNWHTTHPDGHEIL